MSRWLSRCRQPRMAQALFIFRRHSWRRRSFPMWPIARAATGTLSAPQSLADTSSLRACAGRPAEGDDHGVDEVRYRRVGLRPVGLWPRRSARFVGIGCQIFDHLAADGGGLTAVDPDSPRGGGLKQTTSADHQRSTRRPSAAPSSVTTTIARLYQVATNSGESSTQCVA